MAERRMFSKTIIDSDAFLDMPLSSQSLYFHLSMRADDDGFINNVKKIQRMIGCNDDDIKVLLTKKFIIPFDSGVCVIKHWKIHNLIQKDRYKPTVYEDEKSKLYIKNNNVYTLDTKRIHDVHEMEPQVRLVKSSLGEDSKTIGRAEALDDGFIEFWNTYPKKVGKDKAIQAWKKKKPNVDCCIKALAWQIETDQWQKGIIPNPATWINEGRWKDEPINKGVPF